MEETDVCEAFSKSSSQVPALAQPVSETGGMAEHLPVSSTAQIENEHDEAMDIHHLERLTEKNASASVQPRDPKPESSVSLGAVDSSKIISTGQHHIWL